MKRLLTIRLLWASILIGLVSFFGLFILAGNGTFGEMPQFEQLENPNTNLATQIISSDGEILGKYYFNDNRTPITYDELPKNLVDALIATEDERFYNHPGIDIRSTLRAIIFLKALRNCIKNIIFSSLLTQAVPFNYLLLFAHTMHNLQRLNLLKCNR